MTHILAIIVLQPLLPCSANSFLCYARFERFGDSATVDSRLRGNDGMVWLCCYHPHLSPLPSRERGIWLCCLGVAPPCGYCLKASMTDLAVGLSCCMRPPLTSRLRIKSAMTGSAAPALWIPVHAGMTVGFAKVSIKGEGESVGWVCFGVGVCVMLVLGS